MHSPRSRSARSGVRRPSLAVLLATAALVCSGCLGDDGDGEVAAASSSTTASTTATTEALGTGDTAVCAQAATVISPTEAGDQFGGEAWEVAERSISGDGLVVIELSTKESTEYPAVRLGWSCDGVVPVRATTWVPDGGDWIVLADEPIDDTAYTTTTAAPSDDDKGGGDSGGTTTTVVEDDWYPDCDEGGACPPEYGDTGGDPGCESDGTCPPEYDMPAEDWGYVPGCESDGTCPPEAG